MKLDDQIEWDIRNAVMTCNAEGNSDAHPLDVLVPA